MRRKVLEILGCGLLLTGLQFSLVEAKVNVSGVILGEKASVIEKTAAKELVDFLSKWTGKEVPLLTQPTENAILLGTPVSSKLIERVSEGSLSPMLGVPNPIEVWSIANLTEEGFVIAPVIYQANKRLLALAANRPRGIIHGVFTLMEKIRLGVDDIFALNFKEEPWYKFRTIDVWGGEPGLEDMKEPEKSPKVKALVKFLCSLRLSSYTHWNFSTEVLFTEKADEYLAAYDSFSRFLQKYGKDLYLGVRYTPPQAWMEKHERPRCPYNPAVQQYWREVADKLFSSITGLKGYKFTTQISHPGVSVSVFSCYCQECLSKTRDERMLKALQVVSEPLRKYNGKVVYRTFTSGVEQDFELRLLRSVVRRRDFPENVWINTKRGWGDYYLVDFPHPLIGRVSPHTLHMIEVQLFGQYRYGPYCEVTEKWAEFLRSNREKIDGLIGVAGIGPGPLDVNHYSFGRLAWNPATPADEILRDWAKLNYGEAWPSIVKILKMTTEACKKMMYFKGILTQCHGGLSGLAYLDTHICGPWLGVPHIPNKMGWGKSLAVHPLLQEEEYRKDPNMTLFHSRVEFSEELKEEDLTQKKEAIELIEASIDELKKIKPLLEPDVYNDLLDVYNMNLNDYKAWRDCMGLYYDYKLGKLTLSAVEKVWERHKDSKRSGKTSKFEQFVNDLRGELKKAEGKS